MLAKEFKKIVNSVLREYAPKIMQEANSLVNSGDSVVDGIIRSSSSYTIEDGVIHIWYDTELAAYEEFSTGRFSAQYLANKPQEMKDEAWKFYINGKGQTQGTPFFFPTAFKMIEEINKEIDKRLQSYFDSYVIK